MFDFFKTTSMFLSVPEFSPATKPIWVKEELSTFTLPSKETFSIVPEFVVNNPRYVPSFFVKFIPAIFAEFTPIKDPEKAPNGN